MEAEGVASKVMRKLPDWTCANGVLVHVPDDKKQTWEFTGELKLAGEAMDSRNKVQSEASRFFFVTKSFFVTGTIVHNPISCAGLPLEAGLFCMLGGMEGECPTQMQNGAWCG